MIDTPAHLTEDAAQVLTRPDHERIYFIRSKRWIPYPRARQVLNQFEHLLAFPRTTRMPSLAIYGDSGMGKSMIVEKFRDDHAITFDPDTGTARTRLLVVEMAGRPSERRLFAQILAALGAPHSPRATIVDLEQATVRLLRAVGVQVLLIDEVHNILAGTWREQRVMLNTLRYLSNELKLSLVCVGIAEAREAINGDVQLARRFDVMTLLRWSANEEFEQLVLAIVRNLPLRHPSVLTPRGLRRILQVTGGVTAWVFRLLNDVAITAIESGTEEITDAAVDAWRPVSEEEPAFQ
ncbi:TniB family NTP-binding protein [Microvirga mediterraneensis]|uniref:TniB family NTP-binding protein n=1 Tax=Microvirga mediterraneensis TaxID=2754695 RepID=A0A838BX10_9HYPH|nr:TniB family NTP-binding protein [Microvirga mediterraneensis]MBA1159076.1 TniB family NTP-binding protein [Microvirga mediterraneensis]